jgi:hypothetical protein
MKKSTTGGSELLEVDEATMKDAIQRSGYLLERRVATSLRNLGYKAVTNKGFFDPETNKSREYDVYSYKEIEIYEAGSYGIYPTLICECKNNPQPIVFFLQGEEEFEPLQDEVRVSGIPSKIWKLNKYVTIQEFTEIENFHHYCKPEASVATQCCTFELKKDKSSWMASHGEELYETFRTLTKALEYEIDNDFRNMSQWLIPEETEKDFIDLSFYYPVVIFQGDIYGAYIGKNDLVEERELTFKKCQHIQYNPEYFSFYSNEVIYYHIDVITEKYLPFYLKMIDREMLSIKQILQRQKQDVIFSVNKTVLECKSLEKKLTNYRKHLE